MCSVKSSSSSLCKAYTSLFCGVKSVKKLRLLLDLMERWRWMEMKVGFWIMDFHVLETEVQVMIDFIGRCMRIWVTISSGKES